MRSACVITLLLLGAMSHCVVAFVVHPTFSSLRATNIALNALVELVPEPEGGEEIIALSTMSKNTKVKKMGDATSVKLKEGEGPAYQFWLTTEAEAALIQSIYNRVLKDAGKKANFPGFRKGQVPPFALPQIRGFSVQEAIIQTVEAAVKAHGLKALSGSDGEVEVKENIPEVAKKYKAGENVAFTCTLKAMFDPEKVQTSAPSTSSTSSAGDDAIVDVKAEEVVE